MRLLAVALSCLFILSCSSSRSTKAYGRTVIKNQTDAERYSGSEVTLLGLFKQQKGVNGMVVLDSGMRVLLPNFDRFAAKNLNEINWVTKYSEKFVLVKGVLHAYFPVSADGWEGTRLELDSFNMVDSVEITGTFNPYKYDSAYIYVPNVIEIFVPHFQKFAFDHLKMPGWREVLKEKWVTVRGKIHYKKHPADELDRYYIEITDLSR